MVKRPRQQKNLSQLWNDFLEQTEKINDVDITQGASIYPDVPKESILGNMLKRQRVNSAISKHDFSFMPS
jgi:hypothetical protein